MSEISYRPGTAADSYAIFLLFEETFADLTRRMGSTEPTSFGDPEALASMCEERRPLYRHLAAVAEHFWVAERDGRIVGYARSILRGGLRALTEFFVLPGAQSSGAGGELLARAFPAAGAGRRVVIATLDVRAQARYLKAGVTPRFPVYYFGRAPERVDLPTDLSFERLEATPAALAALGAIDARVLAHTRDADQRWLIANRQGYLYWRAGEVVGYGYVGKRSGPFALLSPAGFPAVLAHAESRVAALGHGHFGLEVPTVNRTAVGHLLARGFQIDWFMALWMCDEPFGAPEQYVVTSPPFIL